ncbi:MAG: ribonuclease Z [Bacteroidales bacterium]|nr:ribonuclease Z [Bacteroidales bacterium]MBR0083685.1 ribonuclease Z [Bacteroidales bacterium]
MILNLTTMGTASAMPISDRNPSAQMLSAGGRLFLIDCGEGTQQQMRRCHFSFVRVEAIFISHIHGDHLFGLFGLLNSMAMYGRTAPLDIYGPNALGGVLNFYRSYFGSDDGFEIRFHPLSCKGPEIVHTSKCVTVSAFPLNHKIECYGYRFDEIVTERHREANPAYKAKSYAYCSDTAPFPELPEWVKGVSCLYHEATYPAEMADKAEHRFHSTTEQAARCALQAGAGRLIVGHYSSRVTDFESFLEECRAIFPATQAASDGDCFEI